MLVIVSGFHCRRSCELRLVLLLPEREKLSPNEPERPCVRKVSDDVRVMASDEVW